ncbi:MAG: hypothetical protein RIB84_25300 [Sneathiellaceae bacterium]
MWLRLAGPSPREEAGELAQTPESAADAERAERIMASMAMDTFQVFEHLNRSHARDLSLEKLAEDATRDCILKTLGEARQDAFLSAAERARTFAQDCLRAYDSLPAGHQRVVVKCVAELFDQFAARLEREQGLTSR